MSPHVGMTRACVCVCVCLSVCVCVCLSLFGVPTAMCKVCFITEVREMWISRQSRKKDTALLRVQ